MAYSISIKRKNQDRILLGEWLEIISEDPELELIHVYSAKSPSGLEIKLDVPNSGLWKKILPNMLFRYYDKGGYISVDITDEDNIPKIKAIATRLNAKVVGAEGEEY